MKRAILFLYVDPCLVRRIFRGPCLCSRCYNISIKSNLYEFYNQRQNCSHIHLFKLLFRHCDPFLPSYLVRSVSLPPNNVVPQLLWSWGTNKLHLMGERCFFHNFFAIKRVVLVGALIVLWKDNVSTHFVADCWFSVGNKTKTPRVNQCRKFPFVCVSSVNTHFCHLTGGPSKLNNCGCETSARVWFILRQDSSPPVSTWKIWPKIPCPDYNFC